MKELLLLAALVAPLTFTSAFAETAQQHKMTPCKADAKTMKGTERKKFMKSCLSAKPVTKPNVSFAQQAQRDRMASCKASAGPMKGNERKRYMKTCLSKG